MSEAGVITKQDLAEIVVQARRQDSAARTVMIANLVYTFWTEFAEPERENTVSEAEAERILSELPYEYDDVA